jgi:hypothetical protein
MGKEKYNVFEDVEAEAAHEKRYSTTSCHGTK